MATAPAPAPAPGRSTLWTFARTSPWFGQVVLVWAVTRVLLLLAVMIADWLVGHHALHAELPSLTQGGPVTTTSLLGSWDGWRYQRIAAHGYPGFMPARHQSPYAFFPLLPMLIRVGTWVGLSPLVSGIIVVNLLALAALIAVAALTETMFGAALATRTAIYLAIAPMGFVLGLIYTDGLVIACAFGAVALVLRNRPWLALPLAFAAGLARPTGVLIAIPLAVLAFSGRRIDVPRALVAVAAFAGLGAFAIYCWVRLGEPFAFVQAQRHWGRHPIGWHALQLTYRDIRWGVSGSKIWLSRDMLVTAATAALLIVAARRGVPWYWIVFGVATLVVSPPSGTMEAMARYALYCLPAFWALAMLGENRSVDRTYGILAPALFVLGAVLLPIHFP